VTAPATGSPDPAWLRARWWDLSCLAFCWVPFYVWLVFGLGLDGWDGLASGGLRDAFMLAVLVALGFTYIHRHYTFILVYGDRETFQRRARDFLVAPVLTLALVAFVFSLRRVRLGIGVSPWLVLLTITGLWNVWHTIMQRHGILRAYAGRARGGLEARAHGRRDLWLVWSAVGLVAVVLLMYRQSTFSGHPTGDALVAAVQPFASGAVGLSALALVGGLFGVHLGRWLEYERAARLTRAERVPRLSFLLSTGVLLLVFIVHGPIVGYLCFGVAHALEYVAFVHHFSEKKYVGREGGLAGLLKRPVASSLILGGTLIGIYLLLLDHRRSEPYVVYYTATTVLHFLFDGWIWKMRRPEVARPLGVAMA
jgi:hypothetical protein